MLTEKDYCDYDTCVALKELGCTYTTLFRYIVDDESVPHPTLYEAQKWLRENKGMNVYVKAFNGDGWYYTIQNCKGVRIYPPLARIVVLCHFYEEALLEGIKKAINILKEKL